MQKTTTNKYYSWQSNNTASCKWPSGFFYHFASGCFFLFFFFSFWVVSVFCFALLSFALIELFFMVSKEVNLLQSQISQIIWSSYPVPNSCYFLHYSHEPAWPAPQPQPTAAHPRLSSEDSSGPTRMQAEQAQPLQRWESEDFWSAPSSLCRNTMQFSVILFSWKWKSFSGSYWLLPLASLQERASSVLNFGPLLGSCHFERDLSGFKLLEFLSACNLWEAHPMLTIHIL